MTVEKLPTQPLQAALYTRLRTLGQCTVYDEVPAEPVFPYVYVADMRVERLPVKSHMAADVTATLHFYSAEAGARESQVVADAVLQSLSGTPLQPTGWAVFETTLASFALLLEFSGTVVKRHSTLSVRFRMATV